MFNTLNVRSYIYKKILEEELNTAYVPPMPYPKRYVSSPAYTLSPCTPYLTVDIISIQGLINIQ